MTDSSDYIGELELCPECGERGGHREGCPEVTPRERKEMDILRMRLSSVDLQDVGTDGVAVALAREALDVVREKGWAPPEEVEELRRDAERYRWRPLDSELPQTGGPVLVRLFIYPPFGEPEEAYEVDYFDTKREFWCTSMTRNESAVRRTHFQYIAPPND